MLTVSSVKTILAMYISLSLNTVFIVLSCLLLVLLICFVSFVFLL